MKGCGGAAALLVTLCSKLMTAAAIAQLGERQTEHLKVPSSILGLGMLAAHLLGDAIGPP